MKPLKLEMSAFGSYAGLVEVDFTKAGVTEEERSCLKRVMGKIMKNIQAEQEDGT